MSIRTHSISRPFLKNRKRTSQAAEAQPPSEMWGRIFTVVIVLVWASSFAISFKTSLAILSLAGFAAAVIGLRKPELGLFGIAILCALDTLTRVYLLSVGWNALNYWLLIVMALSLPFLLKLSDPHSRTLQVFLLLLVVELLISPSLEDGVQVILNIITMFGLVIYFARAIQDERLFYWLGVVVGVLGGLGGLVFYLQQSSLTYINPNSWSTFPLAALFAVCLSFPFAAAKKRSRLALLILAGVNLIWVFLSGSRGSMLSGVVCMIFLILDTRSLSWSTVLIVTVAAFGLWFSAQFADQLAYTLSRVIRSFDTTYTAVERTSGRLEIAQAGFNVFLERPLGVGTGGFQSEVSEQGISLQAHSAWVKILVENGIPGIILLAAYVVSFVVVGFRARNQTLLLIGMLTTLSFAVAYVSKEFQGKDLWLLGAGATAFLHRSRILPSLPDARQMRRGLRFSRIKLARQTGTPGRAGRFGRLKKRVGLARNA